MARTVSTALMFTLALLLAPCCEVLAALADAGVLAHTDTLHTHHDDDAPPSGEHCAPWLEQVFIPAGDSALWPPAPAGVDAPTLYTLTAVHAPRLPSLIPHAGAPPPARAIYLLTSRFLL